MVSDDCEQIWSRPAALKESSNNGMTSFTLGVFLVEPLNSSK